MGNNQESQLSEAINQNMRLKETDELLAIWNENNHLEWSDEAFSIIREILLERLGNVPAQRIETTEIKHKKRSARKAVISSGLNSRFASLPMIVQILAISLVIAIVPIGFMFLIALVFPALIPYVGIGVGYAIILLSAYSAWDNLINAKISKFGMDAIFINTIQVFLGRDKIKSIYIYKNKNGIRNMGLMMLLITIGGIFQLFSGK